MILLAITVRLVEMWPLPSKKTSKKKKKKKTDMETICLLPQDLMHATEFRSLFL